MTPSELIEAVAEAGGTLELKDDKVRYQMPPERAHLVEELRQQREGIKVLLLGRRISAALPPGVRLLSWQPKEPPVILTRHSVVTDVEGFTTMTLEQLRVALEARRTCFFCRPEGKRGRSPRRRKSGNTRATASAPRTGASPTWWSGWKRWDSRWR
jgi:hypothetical protein